MKLRKYYIAFEDNPDIFFDEAIFIDSDVPYLLWQGGLYAFPIQIAQWGLCLVNRYFGGETDLREPIIQIADFCIDNAVYDKNGHLFWDMAIQREDYGLQSPWKSAMAQGEMMSFLLRVYEITGDSRYAETAENAFAIMEIEIDEGGVLGKFPDGQPSLQEYPSTPFSNVLNGMIFAIFGIYDYTVTFQKKQDFCEKLVRALVDNLSRFDNGLWSRYDLFKGEKTASEIYHWLHIQQLEALDGIYPHNKIKSTVKRWRRDQRSLICRLLRKAKRVWEKAVYKR